MFRLSLENLLARKFRLFSTSLSVMIGVAFLAGSLVLIDTIGATFDGLFSDIYQDVDVVIRSSETIESDFGDVRGTIDANVLEEVLAVDGVAKADVDVEGYAQVVDINGDPIGNPAQGAPTFGVNWTDVEELNPMVIVEGSAPRRPDEVVIDRSTARQGPFEVGDTITILLQNGPTPFVLSGIATFGDADTALGSSISLFTTDTAFDVLGEPGRVQAVSAVADPGVGQADLRDRVDAALGDGLEVMTGEQLTEENQDAVAQALGFFNTFMLIFAVVALFVAAFIIYNTFSIIVAQRTRELALLRSLGARRTQVLGSVLTEAMLVGLVASAVGIGAGIGVATLLQQLLATFGFDIPAGGVVFKVTTVWISLLVGVLVTVVSAVMPSWRASAVAPMEALRSVNTEDSGGLRWRLISGGSLLAGGVALLAWGFFGESGNRMLLIGLGAASVFLAVAALSPTIVRPFARFAGGPIASLTGISGELAQENTMRNPRRTSTTAAALMIGVGLVVTIAIFAESAKASINTIIDESFIGDLVIDSGAFGSGGLSPQLAEDLNALPEVEAASGVRVGFAEIQGEATTVFGVDPETVDDIVDVGVIEGDISSLGETDLAVHDELAADRGWRLGDRVEVRFAETGAQSFRIAVIFARNELSGNFFVGNPAFEKNFPGVFDFQIYVLRSEGAMPAQTRAAVEAVAADYPNAQVQDLQEFKQAQADQINQLLGLVYALLALAIIIALIGIANTLALSIVERTRELGLLRAVGMTRRQLRATVTWESVMIAIFGTMLGMIVGVFFGFLIVRALRDEGFGQFVFPVSQLLTIAVIAALAGVVAAVRPARRAAKLDILRAIGST